MHVLYLAKMALFSHLCEALQDILEAIYNVCAIPSFVAKNIFEVKRVLSQILTF